MKKIIWKIRRAALLVAAVVQGLLWAVVPRRYRPNRPYQQKGVRVVKHTGYVAAGRVYALYFGPGAGYIGGATAYVGIDCRVRNRWGGWTARRIALGLTGNANNVPLAGCY